MVFEIFFLRDERSRIEAERSELWGRAKEYWPNLIKNLLEPNESSKNRLEALGLNESILITADTDKASFRKIIGAIQQHQLVKKIGHHLRDEKTIKFLSCDSWQAKLDSIAKQLSELEKRAPLPARSFLTGISAIALNLFIMGGAGLLENSNCGLWTIVILTFSMNLVFGLRVMRRIRKALAKAE